MSEEKKLTDGEIIKVYEHCFVRERSCRDCILWDEKESCVSSEDVLDLIHRLQAENETLKNKKFGMWKVKFFKAQEEIERLSNENGQLNGYVNGLEYENAELQKQVDELTEERQTLVTKYNQSDEAVDYWCEKYKQAVKDTAKEILQGLVEKAYVNECIDLTVNEVKAWFREDYGVEVE